MENVKHEGPDFANLISDEGIPQGVAIRFNFVGAGVSVAVAGAVATVTIPGVPGAITTIPVQKTVFVMKNGNDATGLVERFDKPFLTLAAARAAKNAFFTGANAPSATNRILTDVESGYYNEPLVLDNFCDFNLNNAVIEVTSTLATATITDNNVACNSVIYGAAEIKRSGALVTTAIITVLNAGTDLTVYCKNIISTVAVPSNIRCANGTQKIYCDSILFSQGAAINCLSGTQYIQARRVEVTTTGSTIITCSTGNQIIDIPQIIDSSGLGMQVSINGNGTQIINGNITGSVSNVNGTQTINGNITNVGPVTTVLCASGGRSVINGNISSTNTGFPAVLFTALTMVINGNVTSENNAGSVGPVYAGIQVGGTGSFILNGNCLVFNSADLTIAPALYNGGGAGFIIINGNLTSDADTTLGVIYCFQPFAEMQLNNCRIVCTNTDGNCINGDLSTGNNILNNCTLIAAGTGISLGDATSFYISYNSRCNILPDPGVTISVGPFIYDPLVV